MPSLRCPPRTFCPLPLSAHPAALCLAAAAAVGAAPAAYLPYESNKDLLKNVALAVSLTNYHPPPSFGRGARGGPAVRRKVFFVRRASDSGGRGSSPRPHARPTRSAAARSPTKYARSRGSGETLQGSGSVAAAALDSEVRAHTDAPRAPHSALRVSALHRGGMDHAFRLYPVARPLPAPWGALGARFANSEASRQRSNGRNAAPIRRFGEDRAACIQPRSRPSDACRERTTPPPTPRRPANVAGNAPPPRTHGLPRYAQPRMLYARASV